MATFFVSLTAVEDICQPGFCTNCQPGDRPQPRLRKPVSDKKLFDTLVTRHQNAVTTYAFALTNDRWAADEAVQDTFVRAWRYLDSFRGEGCFEGWLIRICRNCIITNAAKKFPEPIENSSEVAALPDAKTEVMMMLMVLPAAQREALALCGLLGYSYHIAAEVLDVPVGTIRSRVARGRATLAKVLEQSQSA